MSPSNAYKDYLKSERWKAKRQQVFAYYGKRCYACRTAVGPIQVHHLDYSKLGNEPLESLRPLCYTCHREVTRRERAAGWRKNRTAIFNQFVKEKRSKRV